jgi:hypothetical protein
MISLIVIGIGKGFNFDTFYKGLPYYTYDDEREQSYEPIESVGPQFDSFLKLQQIKTRMSFNCILYLQTDVMIGVKAIHSVQECKIPSHVKLDAKTNNIVDTDRILMCHV